ncbi:MAG: hypothetical protein HYU64_17300 [Armatimonadetes bacterium]|nr:hypothetical protein [Armatimonadota bacterium]
MWKALKKMARRANRSEGNRAGDIPDSDDGQYAREQKMQFLEAQVQFLLDEVGSLKGLVRHLASDRIQDLPLVRETRESFDFQWRNLPIGNAMLSDESWKKDVENTICRFSDLPREWFAGKNVMDAGAGLGRWTYGFGKLGVGSCTSFDISDAGVARTMKVAGEFGPTFQVLKTNVLEERTNPGSANHHVVARKAGS